MCRVWVGCRLSLLLSVFAIVRFMKSVGTISFNLDHLFFRLSEKEERQACRQRKVRLADFLWSKSELPPSILTVWYEEEVRCTPIANTIKEQHRDYRDTYVADDLPIGRTSVKTSIRVAASRRGQRRKVAAVQWIVPRWQCAIATKPPEIVIAERWLTKISRREW